MGADIELPGGVTLFELTSISDHRGAIVELDRQSWHPDDANLQWTMSRSGPGVLRGPHLHKRHRDQLVVVDGDLLVGLADLRRDSSTAALRSSFMLAPLHVLTIPAGVLHGFFSATATTILNATSHEYDPSDDLEIRFDDPDLALTWPTDAPVLSTRDRDAPSLTACLAQCEAAGLRVIDPPR
jgi:dTDP-4-dehydrorhamnose 3,5-epimerase